MQLRKSVKKLRHHNNGDWNTLPESDFEPEEVSRVNTKASVLHSSTANPPSRIHKSLSSTPSSEFIDLARPTIATSTDPKKMANIKYLTKDKSSHSVIRRKPPRPRRDAKAGEQPVARPIRAYTRRPVAFPTLPLSQNQGVDSGQGKVQPHGIGRLMSERFNGNTVKWKKTVDHLSMRSPLINFPPDLSEDEKDDYENLQNSMEISEGEEIKESISFLSLYPSLRAEIIDQIRGESNTLYLDSYYPVKCLLNLDGKTLERIMKENEVIWDNPPYHILKMKARNSNQAIDPDTPPPGATRYALKFLQQEGLPASLLGQWGHLLREAKVTFSGSKRDSTDQANDMGEGKDASEMLQSMATAQLQQAGHVVPSVPAQNFPHKLPGGNTSGPSQDLQQKPRRLPTPPPSKPMPRSIEPDYGHALTVHHARLRNAGIYPPGSAQRALTVERNILNSSQHNHVGISTSAMGSGNRGPAPVALMAPMKHVTPCLEPLPSSIMERPQQEQLNLSTSAQVHQASQWSNATMQLETPSNSPPSAGATLEPIPRPSQVSSTPFQETNSVTKVYIHTASCTPKQNSNPISRPNLVDFPSKQALPSASEVSPGKGQLRDQNQDRNQMHIFGPQLNKPGQEIHPQARYQHSNLPRAETAVLPQHLHSNQQENLRSQNRLRDLDQNLNQQPDQQRLKIPQSPFLNPNPLSTQSQDRSSNKIQSPYQYPVQHPLLKKSHSTLPPYPYYPAGHPSGTSLPTTKPEPQTQRATNPPKAIRKTPVPSPNVSTPSADLDTPSPKPHHLQDSTRIILTPHATVLNAHLKKTYSTQERTSTSISTTTTAAVQETYNSDSGSETDELAISLTVPVSSSTAARGAPAKDVAAASPAPARPATATATAIVEVAAPTKRKRGRPARVADHMAGTASLTAAGNSAVGRGKKLKASAGAGAEEGKKPAQPRRRKGAGEGGEKLEAVALRKVSKEVETKGGG